MHQEGLGKVKGAAVRGSLEYVAKILRLSIDWRDKEKIGIAYYLNFRYNINKSGHIR
jgi:hypothetical protein